MRQKPPDVGIVTIHPGLLAIFPQKRRDCLELIICQFLIRHRRSCTGAFIGIRIELYREVKNGLLGEIWAMLLNGGPGAFGANQEGISLLISVTYEFIQLIAYF